jgi:GTP cyclohydrolase I
MMGTSPEAEALVKQIIQHIGDDITREGLVDTPKRVAQAFQTMFGGYHKDHKKILKTTFDKEIYDDMITLTNIDFYSTCEHHMLPFYGKAHISYIPDRNKIVGVSKLARLVDCFARRLQIQERLTHQIADAIEEGLAPKGVGVIISAQHFCMTARGVQKQNVRMITNTMRGRFLDDPSTREEFLLIANHGSS